MSTTIKMRARIHQGGDVYYEDATQYTVDDVIAQKLIQQNAAIYVSGGPSSDAPVTAIKDASGNVTGLGVGGGKLVNLHRLGNIGTRMLSAGRTGALDNSTVKTFRAIIEIAASGYDAVRPIFVNGSTSATYTVASCNARALANLTDALPTAVAGTLPSSGVVPVAASAIRPSYLVGDWINISSLPRDDGGVGALVCFDAYVSTAATISILGNGSTDNYAGWATRDNRKWIMRYNDGDCVTTPASFVSTTNRIQSPIVGVQYLARGRVITVMGVGDSITDGRGTLIGEGFGTSACESASDINGTVFEWANAGFAGATQGSFILYLPTLITAGVVPDIVVVPNGSLNSFSAPITDSEINYSKTWLAKFLLTCRDNYITPVIWTVLPTNPAIKNYNSSDTKRVEMNAATLLYGSYDVLDFSAALSGDVDGDGQVGMLSGSTSDNIHPNDAGNAILSGILARYLEKVVR